MFNICINNKWILLHHTTIVITKTIHPMAIIKNALQFTGSLGNITAYTMRGSDKIIIRTKGGASGKKIKTSPKFQRTRENNAEFGLCAKVASGIRSAVWPVKHMADYNFTPVLNALAKHVQLMDKHHPRGKRHVLFSQHAYLLEGFHLNKQNTFDSLVRHPLSFQINREALQATIQLPTLEPGINLRIPWPDPVFRFIAALGFMTDNSATRKGHAASAETEWHPVLQPFEERELQLQLPPVAGGIRSATTLLLSIGIETGMPVTNTLIKPLKYHACAKILGTG